MKPVGAFFVPVFMGILLGGAASPWASDSARVRFLGDPSVERFAGGGFGIAATVACPDPVALAGARVTWGFDFDLDGAFDPAGASALAPGDCEHGILKLRRDLFPPAPAVLRLELRLVPDTLVDARALYPGEAGALLSLRRLCARPRNGEPEWVEVANASRAEVSLHKVRLEGRLLSGRLAPGEALIVSGASDTAELRLWQPGARLFAASSWSPLRNSGDTVRLAAAVSPTLFAPLDSAAYSAAASAREGCASAGTEEAGAASHGFALSVPPRWRPDRGNLEVEVKAPSHGSYSLRVFDLDGLERCAPARGAAGPARYTLAPGACALHPAPPALIVLLEPRGAPSVRARIRVAR
jgi:hypothetical protein